MVKITGGDSPGQVVEKWHFRKIESKEYIKYRMGVHIALTCVDCIIISFKRKMSGDAKGSAVIKAKFT